MNPRENLISKISTLFMDKKIRNIKNILVVLLAVVSAFLCAINQEIPLDEARSLMGKEIESSEMGISDLSYVNYSVNEDAIVSTTDDPQIISGSMNTYVDNINVELNTPLDRDMNVQLFYSTTQSEFSEGNSIKLIAYKGDTSIKFELLKNITSFRIDIGTEANINVPLKGIEINNGISSGFQLLMNKLFSLNVFWLQFELFLVLFLFLAMHLIFNLKKMYQKIYKYRWVVGFAVVIFMTLNKLHGDSTSMYDLYVQPGAGSEYVQPVLGDARAIRSDEWLTNTSRILSSRYLEDSSSAYNNIIRATDTHNLTAFNIAAVGNNVFSVFYKLLGVEYGFCFIWNLKIIFSLLITFEFFMILTDRKRILSLLGACLIICSAFFLWWQFPTIIMWAHASIVCFYYFFKTNSRKVKLLYAVATPISAANFVLILYPAWQVPMGFIVLAILAWIVHDNWGDIRKQKLKSWILFALALMFFAFLALIYMRSIKDYTEIISKTVYPGARISTGGYIWNKLLYYVQCFMYPFKDVGNPSELGTLCNLFPLPIILAIILFIKQKKKDWLLGGLIIVLMLLLCYTSIGLPNWLAKVTMLTNSTPERAVDIVGVSCIYLIVIILSKQKIISKRKYFGLALIISGITVLISTCVGMSDYKDYLEIMNAIILTSILTIFATTLLYQYKDKIKKIIYCCMIVILVFVGIQVRPIQKGFDAIDSKPLATEIQKITAEDPQQKWLAVGGLVLSAYSIACGAPTINSVATYPNMELWEKLDPTSQYSDIYNRFEHIVLELTDQPTSFKLVQPDTISWQLSYADIEKTGAKYILSYNDMQIDNEYVTLQKRYGEMGCYIYQITYK